MPNYASVIVMVVKRGAVQSMSHHWAEETAVYCRSVPSSYSE